MNDTTSSSAADAQQEIIDEFAFFSDWTERYQYLIDLGRKLPEFPEALKREEFKVHGCQSQVWLVLRVYSDRPAREILDTEPDYIESIGLAKHLSPTRSNGLVAMLKTLKGHAAKALEAAT
jgi:cysteine desulfuration protein SufE